MAWLVMIALTLNALTKTVEMVTARGKVTIYLDIPIYLWAAWFIYAHM